MTMTGLNFLPRATHAETLAITTGVLGPTIAKGLAIRRPKIVSLAERMDTERLAVRRMQCIRTKYGTGPILLRIPGRSQAVILSPEHVHRVLAGSPEPFATASTERQTAPAHLQLGCLLISHGPERAERLRFNEQVLDSERPVHRLADRFLAIVDEEARRLLVEVRYRGELSWDEFADTWFRVVRRVVFGDTARDDHELTAMIAELRSAANRAFLRPKRRRLRERFFARMNRYLARAEAGSLAGTMAETRTTDVAASSHQDPQWLFPFDPAGMTMFRALALLASYPEHADRARQEISSHRMLAPEYLPYLRACVLESLRLWPTTSILLRQSTEETEWKDGIMPAGTDILIFTPFFHRDDQRLPYADRFSPMLWLEERSAKDCPLIPFSGGPAISPGMNLVLFLTSTMLAALLDGRQVRLKPRWRIPVHRPLPATLNSYSFGFEFEGWTSEHQFAGLW